MIKDFFLLSPYSGIFLSDLEIFRFFSACVIKFNMEGSTNKIRFKCHSIKYYGTKAPISWISFLRKGAWKSCVLAHLLSLYLFCYNFYIEGANAGEVEAYKTKKHFGVFLTHNFQQKFIFFIQIVFHNLQKTPIFSWWYLLYLLTT